VSHARFKLAVAVERIVVVDQLEARSNSPSRLFAQAPVYTGLTGGDEQAVLIGNWNAVYVDILAPATATKRDVNLQWLPDPPVARTQSGSL
jgi:hypothetical protein